MRNDRHGAAGPLRASRRRGAAIGDSRRGKENEDGEGLYLTPAYPYSPENRTSTRRHHPRPGAGELDADFLRLGIFVFAVIITSHLTQIASERGSSCIQILMAQTTDSACTTSNSKH
jgi:hypothetical protein